MKITLSAALLWLCAVPASADSSELPKESKDWIDCVVGAAKQLSLKSAENADAVATSAEVLCYREELAASDEIHRTFSKLAIDNGRRGSDQQSRDAADKLFNDNKRYNHSTAVAVVVAVRAAVTAR